MRDGLCVGTGFTLCRREGSGYDIVCGGGCARRACFQIDHRSPDRGIIPDPAQIWGKIPRNTSNKFLQQSCAASSGGTTTFQDLSTPSNSWIQDPLLLPTVFLIKMFPRHFLSKTHLLIVSSLRFVTAGGVVIIPVRPFLSKRNRWRGSNQGTYSENTREYDICSTKRWNYWWTKRGFEQHFSRSTWGTQYPHCTVTVSKLMSANESSHILLGEEWVCLFICLLERYEYSERNTQAHSYRRAFFP